MKIEPKLFKNLYEIVYLEVKKIRYGNTSSLGGKTDFSPKLWDTKENGQPLSIFLFSGNIQPKNADFLHRIYLKSKKATSKFELDDRTYFKMLRYLYQSFSEELQLESFSYTALKPLEKRFIDDLERGYFRDGAPVEDENKSANVKAASNVILKFYGLLHRQEYLKQAWELLTSKLQRERWGTNFERFALGYMNTKRIKNPHIFDYEISNDTIDCKLFYEDEISNYDCGPLDAIKDLTVGQLEVFMSNLTRLKNKVEEIGGREFEEIKVKKIFEPTAAEYIWWMCKLDPEKLNQIFPKKTSTTVYKLVKITCVFDEAKRAWFIDWIEGTPAYSNQ